MAPQTISRSQNPSNAKGKHTSSETSRTRRSHGTPEALPSLLNRSENMAKKDEKKMDNSIDDAYLVLSKYRDLGYIPFFTADPQMQKDARAQFVGAKEDYQLSHPVGLVLTYATLSKYYPDAPAPQVLQMWKRAVEDWQILGDTTRNLYNSFEYKRWEHFYGRYETTFDKEKNRKSLIESYLLREAGMRASARRTGKKSVDAFDAAAFEFVTFQEAASNDILLNTMFLPEPKSPIGEGSDKREQFQNEKDVKFIDLVARKKQMQSGQRAEPDETDLYLAHIEAQAALHGPRKERKNPAERDPKKALAHSSAMVLTRGLQQAAKTVARNLRPF